MNDQIRAFLDQLDVTLQPFAGPGEVLDLEMVSALLTPLGWTHFIYLVAVEDNLKRNFYAEMRRMERWSTRTLQEKIGDAF